MLADCCRYHALPCPRLRTGDRFSIFLITSCAGALAEQAERKKSLDRNGRGCPLHVCRSLLDHGDAHHFARPPAKRCQGSSLPAGGFPTPSSLHTGPTLTTRSIIFLTRMYCMPQQGLGLARLSKDQSQHLLLVQELAELKGKMDHLYSMLPETKAEEGLDFRAQENLAKKIDRLLSLLDQDNRDVLTPMKGHRLDSPR